MQSEADRCAEYRKFQKIDAAFREGNLVALRAAVERKKPGFARLRACLPRMRHGDRPDFRKVRVYSPGRSPGV
jgi:hypothetical protein